MARHALAPGSHGDISYQPLPNGRVRGTVRFRRLDGTRGKLRVSARSNAAARRTLMESVDEQYATTLAESGVLTPESPFLDLAHEFMDHVEFTQEQRDTTRHENRRLIEKQIAPHMGALAIREIKASTVLRVYKTIYRQTPSTARNVKALISQICSYAVMNDLMIANPAREVKKVKEQARPIYAPAAMELAEFRGVIREYQTREDRMGPRPSDLLGDVVDLILATGARISEAVGLKWEYVDLDAPKPTITIAGKIVDSKGQSSTGRTTSRASRGGAVSLCHPRSSRCSGGGRSRAAVTSSSSTRVLALRTGLRMCIVRCERCVLGRGPMIGS
ncbi:tyrosine-type recombinase/integrase [Agromyces lapidis]|uniref:Tyrosine-type recombinase/integrase n=1 Tax=Agromyces lapidis TaxID=279574 RepID=A0ABV5SQB4_9MICO|nr:hypothetical protein [Agromyces lapidis]